MSNTSLKERFFNRYDVDDQILGLFDLLPSVSFFVKDREGRFMALNQRGCEYCGVSQESDAIGKTDHDFFPQSRADEYQADDWAVIDSGDPILNRIESAPESAGSPRLVLTSKIPLRDRRGRVIGIAGFSRQVEDVREATGTVTAFADVIEYMHEHFDGALLTEDLAKMAKLSVSQFERRFRRAFGTSVRQYLLRVRVENAARRLAQTEETISAIAHGCGFFDHAHFSRSFKRIMNATPSDWRRRNRVRP